ncbi:MAG: hypothetical protein AAB371_00095 [Patescibacteria group bacterium]
MNFSVLFFIFLLFLWFAWQEFKDGKPQWAVVFLIAGFAIFMMSYVSRY